MADTLTFDISSYKPSTKTKQLLKAAPLLLLVGPTGSGKDTIARELLKTGRFHDLITHTTRSPRRNHGVLEISGQNYHFISPAAAEAMLESHEFVEVAKIHGDLYGTSVMEFQKARKESKIAVADIDVQGVRSYMQLSNKTIAVFLLPPSFEALLSRLAKRYGQVNNDQNVNTRLRTALSELNELLNRDYYHAVINDDLNQTLHTVEQITLANQSNRQQNQQARQLAKQLIDDIKNYLNS